MSSGLLHTCCSAPAGAATGTRSRARQDFSVDFHCHVLTPEVEQVVKERPEKLAEPESMILSMGLRSLEHNRSMMAALMPKLIDPEVRLRDMDDMGVDVQVLSPSPTQYYYWADRELSAAVVDLQNQRIAEMCAGSSRRFVGLGTVSLQFPDLAVQQLEHCVRNLGFKGVEISGSVNGKEIADAELWPFWRKAAELGAVVFIHPLGTSLGARVSRFYLANLVGVPLETTIALSYLIFEGVFDRLPSLKICAAHGGGFLASYSGRSDHGWKVRPECQEINKAPSQYLKRIFFDTVMFNAEELGNLIRAVGASQILLGTDYPFDMGNHRPLELLAAVNGLSEVEVEQIRGGNAARLLNLSKSG
jgi:aminocarboxymuconate-semialdehyde decarboxylase